MYVRTHIPTASMIGYCRQCMCLSYVYDATPKRNVIGLRMDPTPKGIHTASERERAMVYKLIFIAR